MKLGADVARALGARSFDVLYDPEYDDGCLDVLLGESLSSRGPGPRERSARFDPAALSRAIFAHGVTTTYFWICYPELSGTIDPYIAGSRDDPECDHRGFFVSSAFPVQVSFHATAGTLLGGIGASAVYWAVLIIPAVVFLLLMRRNERWDWFRRHRVIGWILLIVPALLVGIVWGAGMTFATSLVPSLVMFVPIGVPGEVLIALVPALGFAALLFVPRIRAVRAIDRRVKKEWESSVPSIAAEAVRPAPRAQWSVALMFAPFIVASIVVDFGAGSRWRSSVGVIAASLGLLVALAFEDRILTWAHEARPMEQVRDVGLRSTLKELGLPGDVLVSERPLLALRAASVNRGSPQAVAAGQRVVLLWDKTASLSPRTIAGGVIGSMGVPTMLVIWIVYVPLLALTDETGSHASWQSIVASLAIAALALIREFARRSRVLRASRRSYFRIDLLRGMLFFGRIQARLAAAIMERWNQKRSSPAVAGMKRRLIRRADQGGRVWRSTVKSANRFARQANIPAAMVDRLTAEVIQMVDFPPADEPDAPR